MPAGSLTDPEDGNDGVEDEDPDYELKPFNEQETDGGEDNGDDDFHVKTALSPEPPEDFLDDPYAHPLGDSYNFLVMLSFDTFYHYGSNLATVEQLMGRPADEYHAGPGEKE